ncbi:hypothetical protein [Nocardioides sp. InS609-2]|uniref:hypothetical protein n=1 Tax=Nocardioides sp. InS609-2 TaxID=2760705 RepID=UPI0020BD9AA0|nr:hypothetical protein [Nocardioides sp. InS609-2]
MAKTDPRIDKRKVTMTTHVAMVDADGEPYFETHKAVDYVRPDFLDAYVADAQTRWQTVHVSPEPDAGPGGYDGATHVPAGLEHELAGQTFAATQED